MLPKLGILILIFFSGCQGLFRERWARNELGIGYSVGLSKTLNLGNSRPIEIIHKGFRIGDEFIKLSERWKIDAFAGPAITVPINDQNATGIGLDLLSRIRYTYWIGLEPYLSLKLGFHYFDKRLEPQATNWGVILGGGLGTRVRLTKDFWLFGEYQLWHQSNGSKVWGAPRPNPGWNCDLFIIGIEYKF